MVSEIDEDTLLLLSDFDEYFAVHVVAMKETAGQ